MIPTHGTLENICILWGLNPPSIYPNINYIKIQATSKPFLNALNPIPVRSKSDLNLCIKIFWYIFQDNLSVLENSFRDFLNCWFCFNNIIYEAEPLIIINPLVRSVTLM